MPSSVALYTSISYFYRYTYVGISYRAGLTADHFLSSLMVEQMVTEIVKKLRPWSLRSTKVYYKKSGSRGLVMNLRTNNAAAWAKLEVSVSSHVVVEASRLFGTPIYCWTYICK